MCRCMRWASLWLQPCLCPPWDRAWGLAPHPCDSNPDWDPGARQDQLDTAIFQYKQLLDQQPTHYEALSHLLGLLRRVGRLHEAQAHLAAAAVAAGPHGGC